MLLVYYVELSDRSICLLHLILKVEIKKSCNTIIMVAIIVADTMFWETYAVQLYRASVVIGINKRHYRAVSFIC